MAVIGWREFLSESGSISGAVSSRQDGRMHGLIRLGKRPNTTLVLRSDKPGEPVEAQLIHCSATGCETSETLKPTRNRPNHYFIASGKDAIEVGVNRPTEGRMDVSIGGLTATPQVLHFYADRDLVTMGNIEALPSLMRGGNKIRVGRDHGYGIFAVQDIKAGEVVEEAPVLAQSSPFLTDYTFSAAGKHIIPLGNIALYNHSDSPNCTHALDDSGSVMTLTASRDIRAGDQLSITYGSSLWFQSRGLQPRTLE